MQTSVLKAWLAVTATLLGVSVAVAAEPRSQVPPKSESSKSSESADAKVDWHTDYGAAYRAAQKSQKMLLVLFEPAAGNLAGDVVRAIDAHQSRAGASHVLVRIPQQATGLVQGKQIRFLDHAAFAEMQRQPGVAVVDLANKSSKYYGQVVSAFPFMRGKYYSFSPQHVSAILELPPGSISQRTLIWAVRTHREGPGSTAGVPHQALMREASTHSVRQGQMGVQGHHNWNSRFHQLNAQLGGTATEVVAESWPGQNLLDSCIDCVESWRQSPGHWGAVRRRHRYYGYDIKRGRNGIWYASGLFGN